MATALVSNGDLGVYVRIQPLLDFIIHRASSYLKALPTMVNFTFAAS